MDGAVTAGSGFQKHYSSSRLVLPIPVGTSLWLPLQKAGTGLLGPGSEKTHVSVSVLVSICLQPVKLFTFKGFSTRQSVCMTVHTMMLIHVGIFAADHYSGYSLDSAPLYMPEKLFVCSAWLRLYLIFKDGSPTLCMMFGATEWLFWFWLEQG